jgi:hypothetical protein
MAALPPRIRGFSGLEIRPCEELGSYKKLVPALEAFPHAYIATADDDAYYPRRWLERLVAGTDLNTIVCHRANGITFDHGIIAPYLEWRFNALDGADILPVGVGGVLYPPGSLARTVTDRRFLALCPSGDDLWFYWMGRLAGSRVKKVGHKHRDITWPGSQQHSLMADNLAGTNDEMIAALQAEWPIYPAKVCRKPSLEA